MGDLILKSLERGGPKWSDALDGAHIDVSAVLDEIPQEVNVAAENRAQQRRPTEPALGVHCRARDAQILHDANVPLMLSNLSYTPLRLLKDKIMHGHVTRSP